MRSSVLLWLVLGTVAAHCQPKFTDPIKLQVRVSPPGARIYVEVANEFGNVEPIGPVESPNLDRDRFKQAKLGIGIRIGGDRTPAQARNREPVPSFHGYTPLRIIIEPQYYVDPIDETTGLAVSKAKGFEKADGIYYYPSLSQPELQLPPAPGVLAWAQRTLYWFQLHPIISFMLCSIGGMVAAFVVAVVVPRQKSWRQERAKVDKFNTRLRNLDVQNDVFLGRQFGEWATVKQLGKGGMAVVYLGVSVVTMNEEEAVAIKVMNPELAQDQEYRRRFNREVQISRTLDHPNVVRMIDFGEQEGILYLSMEYIKGQTLRDALPPKGFPLPQAMDLALGMVQGLIHAHGKGVVHRDLKPDNIMVTDKKLVKVMDLGLAKKDESENVTRTGDTFGTPAYMAPEQITGGTLLPATDQYALGVMLFEMVTGRRPFDVADSLTLVMKHLQEPPPLIREFKSQLPEELEAMIDRMLLKDPAKRFKSLVEVQVELSKIQRKYCPV